MARVWLDDLSCGWGEWNEWDNLEDADEVEREMERVRWLQQIGDGCYRVKAKPSAE